MKSMNLVKTKDAIVSRIKKLTKKQRIAILTVILVLVVGLWYYNGLLPNYLYIQQSYDTNIVHTNAKCGTLIVRGIKVTPERKGRNSFFRQHLYRGCRPCSECFSDRQYELYNKYINEN